jgi:outer membrane lipoprotein-sorting protein
VSGRVLLCRVPGDCRWTVALLTLLVLVLPGCSLKPPVPLPVVAEGLLLAALSDQQQQFSSLRGMAKIDITTADETLRSSQLILATKPDRFRVEVLPMFGPPLLSMAIDGTEMAVSIPSRREFYRGPASAENLRRFTHVPLAADLLVQLLLHQVPLINYQQSRSEPGPKLVLDDNGDHQQFLEFDHQLRLTGATFLDSWRRPWLRVQYAGFDAGGSGFPHRIEVSLPQLEVTARIELSELEVNPLLAKDKFQLSVPAGLTVQPLP